MELKFFSVDQLVFPRKEWNWLRGPSLEQASDPHFFLYGCEVSGRTYAWTKHGAEPYSNFDQKKVPLLLLEKNLTEIEAHGLYLKTVFEQTGASKSNDAEWVVALQTLDCLGYDLAEKGLPRFWEAALCASGLEADLGILSNQARFLFLRTSELQFLFNRKWDLSTFELIETWPTPVRESFLKAIEPWSISSDHAKEMTSNIFLLLKKTEEKTVVQILENKVSSPEDFRMMLFRTAQPEFSKLSEKRIEQLRGLSVPPRTIVFGDPEFEKDILRITHTPRKLKDFTAFQEWIADPALSDKIKELLEIYQ